MEYFEAMCTLVNRYGLSVLMFVIIWVGWIFG